MRHNILTIAMLAALTIMVGSCGSDDDSDDEFKPQVPEYLVEGTATRPMWKAADYNLFEHIMSLQVQLGDTLAYFQSQQDLMCATINGEVRAVSEPQTTADVTYFPLSIASSGTEGKVTLHYYCDRLRRIYTITDWATFDPYVAPSGESGIYRPKFTQY